MTTFDLSALGAKLGDAQVQLKEGDELGHVNPNDVQLDKLNPRKKIDQKKIEGLASSIRKQGLDQLPLAEALETKTIIRIGARRTLAFRLLQEQFGHEEPTKTNYFAYTQMPVIFRKFEGRGNLSKRAVITISQITENRERENVSPFEEAIALRDLIAEIGREAAIEELESSAVKVSESWVSKRLALLKCNEEVHDWCDQQVPQVNDVETRVLLGRIYEASEPEYAALCRKFEENELTGNLRKVASDIWQRLSKSQFQPPRDPVVSTSIGGGGSMPNERSDYDSTAKTLEAEDRKNWLRKQDLLDQQERAERLSQQKAEEQLPLPGTDATEEVVQDNSTDAQNETVNSNTQQVVEADQQVVEAAPPAHQNSTTNLEADAQPIELVATMVGVEGNKMMLVSDNKVYWITLPEALKVTVEEV